MQWVASIPALGALQNPVQSIPKPPNSGPAWMWWSGRGRAYRMTHGGQSSPLCCVKGSQPTKGGRLWTERLSLTRVRTQMALAALLDASRSKDDQISISGTGTRQRRHTGP